MKVNLGVLLPALIPLFLSAQALPAPLTGIERTPVKIAIAPLEPAFEGIDDIVLNIRIENTSELSLTVLTVDREPPLGVSVSDDLGRSRAVGHEPKRGKSSTKESGTRNREFTLGPHETETYNVHLRDLLRAGQRLLDLGPGVLRIWVALPVVHNDNGLLRVELVKSNSCKVGVSR